MKNKWQILLSGMVLMFGCMTGEAKAVTIPAALHDEAKATAPGEAKLVVAGGCFWGIEAVFLHVKGVKNAVSGYAGGTKDTATYGQVSEGNTGHAEAVEVTYDPSQVTMGKLLQVFFSVAHNPTELNRQGPDSGTQYRSAIFFTTSEQKQIAADYIAQLDKAGVFDKPVATALEPLAAFYKAEPHHQNYVSFHPDSLYVMIHDAPKLVALEDTFPDIYVK